MTIFHASNLREKSLGSRPARRRSEMAATPLATACGRRKMAVGSDKGGGVVDGGCRSAKMK
jgi:hypothetical protein